MPVRSGACLLPIINYILWLILATWDRILPHCVASPGALASRSLDFSHLGTPSFPWDPLGNPTLSPWGWRTSKVVVWSHDLAIVSTYALM